MPASAGSRETGTRSGRPNDPADSCSLPNLYLTCLVTYEVVAAQRDAYDLSPLQLELPTWQMGVLTG
jgi:hypothetical protein